MEAPTELPPRANRLRVARGRRSAADGHDYAWNRAAGAECAIPGRPALETIEDTARDRHLVDVTRARPPRADIIVPDGDPEYPDDPERRKHSVTWKREPARCW